MTIYLEPWRRLAFDALPALLDAAGKGVVLLAAAGAVVLAMRKRSAAARQTVWLPAGLDGRRNRRALVRRAAIVALAAIAAMAMPTACSKAPQKAQFKDATITLYMDLQSGKYVPDSKQATALKVTDQKQLEALLAFFPEMDRGKESWRAAGWMTGVEIKFAKRDGKTIGVAAPPELEVWSEGKGDWPVNGDLKAFLLALQKAQAATQPAATTQPAPSASPGQATAPATVGASTKPAEMVITPGVGVGPITLGMSKEDVIRHLGKPVKIEGEGGYGLNYISSMGLSVLVSRNKGVFFISCWTPGATYWLHGLFVKDFRGVMDKGIKMGARREEIIRAYGRADSESSESGDASLLYMDYRSQGIEFMLRWGKLAKIDVVEPDVFALVPAAAFSQPAAITQPAPSTGSRQAGSRPAATPGRPSASPRALKVGDVAPDFEIKSLDGAAIKLSSYRGKYVVLNFWATWCGPCKAETPALIAAYNAFGDDDRVAFISLSLDEEAKAPMRYVALENLKWAQGLLGKWPDSVVRKRYGVESIPAIFLIDSSGNVAANNLRGRAAIMKALKDALPPRAESPAIELTGRVLSTSGRPASRVKGDKTLTTEGAAGRAFP